MFAVVGYRGPAVVRALNLYACLDRGLVSSFSRFSNDRFDGARNQRAGVPAPLGRWTEDKLEENPKISPKMRILRL